MPRLGFVEDFSPRVVIFLAPPANNRATQESSERNMRPPLTDDQFSALVEEHKGIIYKIANSYCRNAEDRKDLIQEIVVHLWKSHGRYDDRFKLSTWIYRIALNVAISAYRREKTCPQTRPDPEPEFAGPQDSAVG